MAEFCHAFNVPSLERPTIFDRLKQTLFIARRRDICAHETTHQGRPKANASRKSSGGKNKEVRVGKGQNLVDDHVKNALKLTYRHL